MPSERVVMSDPTELREDVSEWVEWDRGEVIDSIEETSGGGGDDDDDDGDDDGDDGDNDG
jgi:hypothetical protein